MSKEIREYILTISPLPFLGRVGCIKDFFKSEKEKMKNMKEMERYR